MTHPAQTFGEAWAKEQVQGHPVTEPDDTAVLFTASGWLQYF